ncbi:MAG: hypothetical protein OEZ59_06615, partial [Deltaproteobacteria bacterium]|nr:hypothetical protein [Deltaproteobacteria bacterium]
MEYEQKTGLRNTLLLVVVFMALVLAGCGGEDDKKAAESYCPTDGATPNELTVNDGAQTTTYTEGSLGTAASCAPVVQAIVMMSGVQYNAYANYGDPASVVWILTPDPTPVGSSIPLAIETSPDGETVCNGTTPTLNMTEYGGVGGIASGTYSSGPLNYISGPGTCSGTISGYL